jgi:hypothetical protein
VVVEGICHLFRGRSRPSYKLGHFGPPNVGEVDLIEGVGASCLFLACAEGVAGEAEGGTVVDLADEGAVGGELQGGEVAFDVGDGQPEEVVQVREEETPLDAVEQRTDGDGVDLAEWAGAYVAVLEVSESMLRM